MRRRARAVTHGLVLALVATGCAGAGLAVRGEAAVLRAGLLAAPGDPTPTGTPGPVTAAPLPEPDRPRLAFTDDRDHVAAAEVLRRSEGEGEGDVLLATGPYRFPRSGEAEPPLSLADGSAPHIGELSRTHREFDEGETQAGAAFVSTADGDADGEVYVWRDGEAAPVPVTCDNDVVESHPVLSDDGAAVAYAAEVDGNVDIMVLRFAEDAFSDDGRQRPCADALPAAARITDDPGADLWPSWLDGSSALVFSSQRTDPLGDLYYAELDPGEDGDTVRVLHQLTAGPSADTQPAVASDGRPGSTPVAFTTTRYRVDGSLALLHLPDDPAALEEGSAEVLPLWREDTGSPDPLPDTPQSSEPAWSPDDDHLLYTTTRDDPYGDVVVDPVRADGEASGYRLLAPSVTAAGVGDEPGVAESHGAFTDRFGGGDGGSPSTEVTFTRRAHDADVSDVVAADGGARRVIADTTAPGDADGGVGPDQDDAGPSYSPDGMRVVWSAGPAGDSPDGTARGYRLWVADADGTDPVPLAYPRDDDDIDVDPVWSPDGTRIAFVRYHRPPGSEGGYQPARVWVTTLATGDAVPVTPAGSDGVEIRDLDPSWSPDGTRLAVGRQVHRFADAAVTLAAAPERLLAGATTQLTVTVERSGFPETATAAVTVPAGVELTEPLPAGCAPGPGSATFSCSLPPDDDARSWSIPLSASRAGTYVVGALVALGVEDPEPFDDAAQVTLAVVPPAPQIRLAVDPTSLVPGAASTATITVAQAGVGPSGAALEVTLPLPGFLGVGDGLDARCRRAGADVSCRLTGVTGTETSVTVPLVAGEEDADGDLVARALGPGGTTSSAPVRVDVCFCEGVVESPEPGPEPDPDSGSEATPELVSAPVTAMGARASLAAAASRVARSTRPGDSQVWVLDLVAGTGRVLASPVVDCGLVRVCPPEPLTGRSPAWSPDGTTIAYEDGGALHLATLVSGSPTGTEDPEPVATLTQITGILPDGSATPSRATLSVTEDPAWSPDGTEIAVAGQPAGAPDQRGVYALDPDGSGVRTVAQERGPETEPAWQPFGDLSVTITADPPVVDQPSTTTVTIGVTNDGPVPATDVRLHVTFPPGLEAISEASGACTVSTGLVSCGPVATLAPGAALTYAVVARGVSDGTVAVTATTVSRMPERAVADNTATTFVVVGPARADLEVDVTLGEDDAWAGGVPVTVTVRVRNAGPAPALEAAVTVTGPTFGTLAVTTPACTPAPPTTCSLGTLAPDGSVTVVGTVSFPAPAAPSPAPSPPPAPPPPSADDGPRPSEVGPVRAEVTTTTIDPVGSNDTDEALLTLHHPTIRLLPRVAKPGTVVLAYGQDFPPGASVGLTWSRGITSTSGPVRVEEDGTLRYPIPLVRRDQLGDRALIATSVDGDPPVAAAPALFGPVHGPVLVVPRSVGIWPDPELLGRG